jgi:hypothetical protein
MYMITDVLLNFIFYGEISQSYYHRDINDNSNYYVGIDPTPAPPIPPPVVIKN